jgi:hypothetical protein
MKAQKAGVKEVVRPFVKNFIPHCRCSILKERRHGLESRKWRPTLGCWVFLREMWYPCTPRIDALLEERE